MILRKRISIEEYLLRFGYFGLLKKILHAIRFRLANIRTLIIFELDVTKPIKEVFVPALALTYRLASEQDIELMEKDLDYDEKGKAFSKDRLIKGDKCVLAIFDQSIIGYIWIMLNEMELSQYNHIHLAKHKVYIYKGFVKEEFRGKRVLNGIDHQIVGIVKGDGKQQIVTTIDVKNTSSTINRERVGFSRIGKIIGITILGFQYDFISSKDRFRLQAT